MNKADLVDRIAGACGISKAQATTAIDTTVDSVTAALRKGDRVALIGFARSPSRSARPAMAETRRRAPPSRSLLVESPNSLPETNSRKWSIKVSKGPRILGYERDGRRSAPAVLLSGLRRPGSDAKVFLRPNT